MLLLATYSPCDCFALFLPNLRTFFVTADLGNTSAFVAGQPFCHRVKYKGNYSLLSFKFVVDYKLNLPSFTESAY